MTKVELKSKRFDSYSEIRPDINIKSGTKVHYKDSSGKVENGIIQTYLPAPVITEVFVVYKQQCGGNWDKYQNYTAARTRLSDLYPGWKLQVNFKFDHLIKKTIHNAHK